MAVTALNKASFLAVYLAMPLFALPAAQAESPQDEWPPVGLALSLRADNLEQFAPETDGSADFGGTPYDIGESDDKLALELAFDEDIKLVMPTKQLLKVPNKQFMFQLEFEF
jgi:hypothetical protein